MKRFVVFASLLATGLAGPAVADNVRVVGSIPDLAVIATAIGGGRVDAESIVTGNRDIHAVELFPSLMLKVRRADVYIKVGLDLDLWAQQIIDGSRNAKLVIVDASVHVAKLEIPSFKVDASYGDIHRYGNPHYWLDPQNTRPMAEAILEGLTKADPASSAAFRSNMESYLARMDESMRRWHKTLAPFAGMPVVSFHNSWPYFAKRFNLKVVETLEPKPGVPPTPSHIAAVTQLLKSGGAKVILMEAYFDDRVPMMLSRTTGVPVVKVPAFSGELPGVNDQFALFDTITSALAQALASSVGGR